MTTTATTNTTTTAVNTNLFTTLVNGWFGWIFVRVVLIAIIVAWTLPTVGLLVSSVRDRDAINQTGWWTTFSTRTSADQERTATAEEQVEVDGGFVIRGTIFEEETSTTR